VARSSIRVTQTADSSELAEELVPKMTNLGQAVGRRMQRLVPKRSWSLHDTIDAKTERSGSKVVTTVSAGGGKVKYALFVERGTSRMAAQPFMRPAFAQTTGKDLSYSGAGITTHGVVTFSTRRTRARRRRGGAR